jgi:cytochrome b6-f complex iron-sulfur subunit
MTLLPLNPPNDEVPSLGRRQVMNLLTFGAITGVALGALYPVVRYFIPPGEAGSSGGSLALDELGKPIVASGWLASHPEGDRSLVQGLKGDPTYLVVEGGVVRGPAPLPLALAHVAVEGERVQLSAWRETDPRTGEKPWWS